MKRISVIVPCLNEQEVIPVYYQTMVPVMEKMKDAEFELLFIDDGSDDRTLHILRELNKKDKRCRYLSFTRNFGKEAAIYAGLEHAKGDYIAVMDVDLQDPPRLLPLMCEELQKESMTVSQQDVLTGPGRRKSVPSCRACSIKLLTGFPEYSW